MSLQQEIDFRTSKIYRDAYQMSIGELLNLYQDGEIDIHPEFQRVFRWTGYQKTRLIESIMLNIPIPPVFVSQREDGVWDVIDGVQRLSTIFEFVGILKNEKDEVMTPTVLQATDYLPSFQGMMWAGDRREYSFTTEQKINFKRSRIDVIIVKKESDDKTKYELFQRLNTGGSRLSSQEVRNCLMIMTNRALYEFIRDLDGCDAFQICVPVSDRKSDEQFRLELIVRLLVAVFCDIADKSRSMDLSALLDEETLKLCSMPLDYSDIKHNFFRTFELLRNIEGENIFKKRSYNGYRGGFLSAAYQGIAVGVFSHICSMEREENEHWIKEKIEQFYLSEEFKKMLAQGVRPVQRFIELSRYGQTLFKS